MFWGIAVLHICIFKIKAEHQTRRVNSELAEFDKILAESIKSAPEWFCNNILVGSSKGYVF